MKIFSKLMMVAALALGFGTTASAQSAEEKLDYQPFPHLFVSTQGGIQTTLTDYNNAKLITPMTGLGFGAWFTPVVGARIHGSGVWNKGGYRAPGTDYKYDYKFVTTDLDLMLNLCTLFGNKDYYPVNVYLIGGMGVNYAWDNDDAYSRLDLMPRAFRNNRWSHNGRIGAQVDVNLHKHVSLNLEVAANSLNDRFNSKVNQKDDWQLTAQVGLAFKFGYKKKKGQEKEIWATRIDTIWYDDVQTNAKVENGKVTWEVFYRIRESDFEADKQLKAIGEFLSSHRECKVDIKSYADRGTGNPTINAQYAKSRAEKAVKALMDAGVDGSIITSSSYGDSVQPYAENDKNRVTIITATGLKDIEGLSAGKKFRTKEVRYRVD